MHILVFQVPGKTPSERNLAVNVQENIITYKVGIHQHIPEMEQELSCLANSNVSIVFVPHVLPFKYGILTTMYLKLNSDISWEKIKSIYDEYYDGKPFVRIMDKNKYPEIKNVVGTNFCDIGINIDSRTNTCVVITAIDNLIKGASGQAVQNMNLMFGFNEVEGITVFTFINKRGGEINGNSERTKTGVDN